MGDVSRTAVSRPSSEANEPEAEELPPNESQGARRRELETPPAAASEVVIGRLSGDHALAAAQDQAPRGGPHGVGAALRGPLGAGLERPNPTGDFPAVGSTRPPVGPVEGPSEGAGRAARNGQGRPPVSTGRGPVGAMKLVFRLSRRLALALFLLASLAIGGVLGLSKVGVDLLPPQHMRKIHFYAGYLGENAGRIKDRLAGEFRSYFRGHEEEAHQEAHKVVVTSPRVQDVTIIEPFVCQIRSQRHIEVRALEPGYLLHIAVREGQMVSKDHVMFKIQPILYEARLDAEKAERDLADMEYQYNEGLRKENVVSQNQLNLLRAKLAKTKAKVKQAEAELGFTEVKAPFDGIVDRLHEREGSLIKEGDILTTLSDNSVMWVYFNVPEKYYLEYMANREQHEKNDKIELMLANGDIFPQVCTSVTIEADVNNENGNIKFRADFPNPGRLLRHGQTGTIRVRRPLKGSLVIPQRATFELLDKRYVWVLGEDDAAHRRLIATSRHELEDIFVVEKGLVPGDRIVLEGIREVEEGRKVEFEFRRPEDALENQKFHAE